MDVVSLIDWVKDKEKHLAMIGVSSVCYCSVWK